MFYEDLFIELKLKSWIKFWFIENNYLLNINLVLWTNIYGIQYYM